MICTLYLCTVFRYITNVAFVNERKMIDLGPNVEIRQYFRKKEKLDSTAIRLPTVVYRSV